MNDAKDDWIMDQIETGIQKLLCLRLDGAPAADMVAGTIGAWFEAITDRREFDERLDAPRMQAGFRTLAATREKWPAPKHFMEVLPDRPPVPQPRRLVSDTDRAARRAAAKKAMADLAEKMRMPT